MKIFLTKRAVVNYRLIKERIEYNWGEQVAKVFEQKTVDFISLLRNFPEIGSVAVHDKQIRGFQLTKQTKVYYRIKGDTMTILLFFDVRQNPDRKNQ